MCICFLGSTIGQYAEANNAEKSVSPAREIHLNQEAIRAIKKAAEIFGIE